MLSLFQYCCGFSYLAGLVTDDAALRGHESLSSHGREKGGRYRRRCRTPGALAFCLLTALPFSTSRAEEPLFDIDIPALNAAEALNRLAEQTGSVMLFSYDLARTRQANAVRGRYTLLEGLELLLRETGLSGGLSEKRVVAIADERNMPVGKGESVKKRGLLAGIIAVLAGSNSIDVRADQESEPSRLEEVLVTAQKREERLQDVPMSVSVLGGERLDEYTGNGVTDALRDVPGVATTVHAQGGGTQISVRGVAANGVLFRGSSPVSYYLDGMPFGLVKSAAAPNADVYDLARVEVLRGPQGTLYGAGAQNGVVRILTHEADLEDFEVKARGSVSTTEHGGDNYRADFALNLPVVEGKLGLRLVGGVEDLSGWIDKPNAGTDDVNDAERSNWRMRADSRPTDRLSFGFSSWFSRDDRGGQDASQNGRTHFSAFQEPISTDYDVHGLRVGYDFDGFSLSSITSYLDYENHSFEDLRQEGFPGELGTNFFGRAFSQEVNLTSGDSGVWRWSAGAFYRDAKDRLTADIFIDPDVIHFIDNDNLSSSYALYGEITRRFADGWWEFTVGGRYFEDEVTQEENIPYDGDTTRPLITTESTFDHFSPRVVLTWHPSKNATFYTSYSEGFRSGFNQDADIIGEHPEFPPVQPDTLRNYEIGAHGTLWSGQLNYDFAAYYIDWQDVQLVQSLFIDGLFVPAPINGDSASGPGVELTLSAEPSDSFGFAIGVGWNDLTSDTTVVSSGQVLFAEGDRLNYSPEFTGTASVEYRIDLGGDFQVVIGASANYMSEQTFRNIEGGVSVNYPGDDLFTSRASFALESPSHWTATAFVDNASDENGRFIGGSFGDLDNAPHLRPRTWGIQFEYHY